MRRRLTRFTRPAALLLVLVYLLGAVPAYCAHCFAPVVGMQAQPDNHAAGMVAACCQCNFQLSGLHYSSSTAVNTAKTSPQPVPVMGPVVALLDVTGSAATWQRRPARPQFLSPSRVLNYGVRLE